MTLCLLKADFDDSIHERDSQRLIRCWKFFLLIFKEIDMDLVPIKDGVISLYPLKASLLVSYMYIGKLYHPPSVCHRLTQPRPREGSGEAPMTDG